MSHAIVKLKFWKYINVVIVFVIAAGKLQLAVGKISRYLRGYLTRGQGTLGK